MCCSRVATDREVCKASGKVLASSYSARRSGTQSGWRERKNVRRALITPLLRTHAESHLTVFDTRYYSAISAADAWQIISEEDYDAGDARSGTRPTTSSLRVAELAQLIAGASPLVSSRTVPSDALVSRSLSPTSHTIRHSVPSHAPLTASRVLRSAHHLIPRCLRVALVRHSSWRARTVDSGNRGCWRYLEACASRGQRKMDERKVCGMGRGRCECSPFHRHLQPDPLIIVPPAVLPHPLRSRCVSVTFGRVATTRRRCVGAERGHLVRPRTSRVRTTCRPF